MISQIGFKNAAKVVFELVVQQLNEFIMPNIMKKQKEQINLSLYYYATEIDSKIAYSLEKVIFYSNYA